MTDYVELNIARKKLVDALGDKSEIYFRHMKLWFQMKCTKEEFDSESRKIMSIEQVCLHNEFLLCLFNKCQSLALPPGCGLRSTELGNSKKQKLKKKNRSDKSGFEPIDVADYLPELRSPPSQAFNEPVRYCTQELFLPDVSLIFGRMLLASWERGLEGAEESAAEYLVTAVQYLIKNVLTAVFSRKNGYRVRDRHFMYGMGSTIPNPWLSSTIKVMNLNKTSKPDYEENDMDDGLDEPLKKPTLEDIEQRAAFEIACGPDAVKTPVTPYHVLEALQVYPHIIPSDSVYSVYVERVIHKLTHPSHEELEAAS